MSKADAFDQTGKIAVQQNIQGTLDFLNKFPPFNQMDTAHLGYMVENCKLRFYAAGDTIIKPQDGPVEYFYVVKQGRIHGKRADAKRATQRGEDGAGTLRISRHGAAPRPWA